MQTDKKQFEYHKIGSIIRKLRNDKGLKLIELASITGIKSSMLSKIENGRMIPTIPTLFSIIYKLGIPVDLFFAEFVSQSQFEGYTFLPKESFAPYQKEEEALGFNYFSILETGLSAGSMQISLLQLQPDCKRELVSTAAFEFIMLLNGTLSYQLNNKFIEMKEGDALFFDGNIPHVPHNNSSEQANLFVIYFFGDINNVSG